MSMENNDKYIAKSWIDDGAEEEFKKSFLESLLNQWQGEGNDFNADKLDGKHYCEIINEVDQKIEGLIPAFQIGLVRFNKENIEKQDNGILKIGFDGVQLNIPGVDGYDDYMKLPWDESNRVEIPDLLEVFQELYEIVETKVDQDEFDSTDERVGTLENFKDGLSSRLTFDKQGNVTHINSDSVNGVSIYVKTPAQYDAMLNDPTYKELLEDSQNLFIITEPGAEISDTILAKQPGTQVPSYYIFDIQKIEGENWLVYRHQDGTTWHEVCKTSDFIDPEDFMEKFTDAMGESSNYVINQESFVNSLEQVQINDGSSYPLAQYIRSSGIKGLKVTKEEYEDFTFPTIPETGENKYVNVDDMLDKIFSSINTKIENEIGSIFDSIYPIGSIYVSYLPKSQFNPNDSTNPFKGTWEQIEGRFLLGAGSIIENNVTYTFKATDGERTGGEIKHTLSLNETPKHTHDHDHLHKVPTALKTTVGQNIKVGTVKRLPPKDSSGAYWVYGTVNGNEKGIAEGGNTGEVTDNSPHSNKTTSAVGNNGSHNNMPPYTVVTIWRRTA